MESLVEKTGLSTDGIGIFSVTIIIVGLLAIVSHATKPKQIIKPSEGIEQDRKKKKKKKSKRKIRFFGKHEFVNRPSLLDSGMAIVVPWRTDNPRSNLMKKSVFRGWYNLCWILGSAWLLNYFMSTYIETGYLIGHLDFFVSLFHYIHELLIMLLPIYALSFSAYLLEKLMSQEIFGRKYTRYILHGVQHIIQTVMIFGMYI